MTPKVLEILQAGLASLEAEIQQIDEAIEKEASEHGRESVAAMILIAGRANRQAQADVLTQTIHQVRLAAEGKLEQPATSKTITPGQYTGMKLSTAVQAYLSERGRGPVACAKIVEDLTLAGVRMNMSRSKLRRGELRELNTRDVRLLGANSTKRFVYDSVSDTLEMTPATGNDTGWKRQRKPRGALIPAAATG